MLKRIIFVPLFILIIAKAKGQILFNMGNYRNLAYTSAGYNGAFENTTIGIARRDYVRIIKHEVVGFLDVSLPITNRFFTRRSIRKGFQFDIYKKNDFRVPFIFASSSIFRENRYYKFHDVTAEFSFVPGFYSNKYSLALDIRYELIVFRRKAYRSDYLNEIDPGAKSHWEKPYYSIGKFGIMAGLNLKHCVIYIKSGYERNPVLTHNYIPGYLLFGLGYKFGTKPIN